MAETKIPYVTTYGGITKALAAIKRAQTPERFTQDFLATKLGLKGGSQRPLIPFLKRIGFLASDGTPTSLYTRFRNQSQSGAAVAEGLRKGFDALYQLNEYVHEVGDAELKGIVLQATGLQEDSSQIKLIIGSFKALREFANFDGPTAVMADSDVSAPEAPERPVTSLAGGLNLGYTINLHLPATSDIAVYNAIFKSLRDHLLG